MLYHGPAAKYRGRELCFNAAGFVLDIADVTDKQHPKTISLATYPQVGYTHQGWLTDDQRYFVLDDELDEGLDFTQALRADTPGGPPPTRTRTLVFDLTDLEDPVVARAFYGPTAATDHNLYIRGRYLYQANYLAGLRVLDIATPTQPTEVSYFDTTPASANTPAWEGTWIRKVNQSRAGASG